MPFNPEDIVTISTRASAAATTAFIATTAGNALMCNQLIVEVTYTAGASDACEFYLEGSNDDGTTYFREVGEATVAGTITTTLAVHSIAGAQAGSLLIAIPFKADLVRAQVRVTDTDAGGVAGNLVALRIRGSRIYT